MYAPVRKRILNPKTDCSQALNELAGHPYPQGTSSLKK